MAPYLRALTALVEDRGFAPGAHMSVLGISRPLLASLGTA